MIDGIKFNSDITGIFEDVKRKVSPKTPVNVETGEMDNYKYINKNGLQIVIKEPTRSNKKVLICKGSIHAYYHGSNHTDFNFNDLCNALDQLAEETGLKLDECKIDYLEFGVNIKTELKPSDYYEEFILYRNEKFDRINYPDATSKKPLKGVQCAKTNMIIKCYDKGNQKNLPYHLLRFEIKTKIMRFIRRKTGINRTLVLSDLKNKAIYQPLRETLVKVHDDILKVKAIDASRLNDSDKELMNVGRFPMFWITLKREKGRSKHDTRLKRFKAIQSEYGIDNCKQNKLNKLLNDHYLNLENCIAFTEIDAKSSINSYAFNNENGKPIDAKSSANNDGIKNGQKIAIDAKSSLVYKMTLRQCLLPHELKRKENSLCIVCAVDISDRKNTATTCSKKCRNKKSNSYQNCQRKLRKLIKLIETGQSMITMEYLMQHEQLIINQIMQSMKSYRVDNDLTQTVEQYNLFNRPPLTND